MHGKAAGHHHRQHHHRPPLHRVTAAAEGAEVRPTRRHPPRRRRRRRVRKRHPVPGPVGRRRCPARRTRAALHPARPRGTGPAPPVRRCRPGAPPQALPAALPPSATRSFEMRTAPPAARTPTCGAPAPPPSAPWPRWHEPYLPSAETCRFRPHKQPSTVPLPMRDGTSTSGAVSEHGPGRVAPPTINSAPLTSVNSIPRTWLRESCRRSGDARPRPDVYPRQRSSLAKRSVTRVQESSAADGSCTSRPGKKKACCAPG